ncbi:transcriptional regulator-domain-containing protein [Mycena haematopus]|nr:transcriptional regulator-domain-containing protein [Mycena haematopus]
MLRSTTAIRLVASSLCSFSSAHPTLSGHNKWSKIKEKKGINDTKKSAAYTKASREIMTAVRLGGSADPETNSALAAILRRLKDIPKENIQNALDKAIKKRDQCGEDVVYQALAYGKVGLMIECTTDNRARTTGNIRHILSEHEAHIAAVGFMFRRIGSVKVIAKKEPDELALIKIIDIAMENGAEDITEHFWTDMEVELQVGQVALFQYQNDRENSLPVHRNYSVNSQPHCQLPVSVKHC